MTKKKVKVGGKGGNPAHGVLRANISPSLAAPRVKCPPSQLVTLGGRIQCSQCQAMSKRSGAQCQGPAVRGKTVCRMHGGMSTGPRTQEGRLHCAEAKTIHGQETAIMRKERSLGSARMAVLESAGHALGLLSGPRTSGRKPGRMAEAYPELQAAMKLRRLLPPVNQG